MRVWTGCPATLQTKGESSAKRTIDGNLPQVTSSVAITCVLSAKGAGPAAETFTTAAA